MSGGAYGTSIEEMQAAANHVLEVNAVSYTHLTLPTTPYV